MSWDILRVMIMLAARADVDQVHRKGIPLTVPGDVGEAVGNGDRENNLVMGWVLHDIVPVCAQHVPCLTVEIVDGETHLIVDLDLDVSDIETVPQVMLRIDQDTIRRSVAIDVRQHQIVGVEFRTRRWVSHGRQGNQRQNQRRVLHHALHERAMCPLKISGMLSILNIY